MRACFMNIFARSWSGPVVPISDIQGNTSHPDVGDYGLRFGFNSFFMLILALNILHYFTLSSSVHLDSGKMRVAVVMHMLLSCILMHMYFRSMAANRFFYFSRSPWRHRVFTLVPPCCWTSKMVLFCRKFSDITLESRRSIYIRSDVWRGLEYWES